VSDLPNSQTLPTQASTSDQQRRVLAFYQFTDVPQPAVLRDELEAFGVEQQLKGTILLAQEGINGTVVGTLEALELLQVRLAEDFSELPYKWSSLDAKNPGFHRFKVRVKPEIVSFGVPDLDVGHTGEHVDVQRWHELLDDDEVVVIDTRNQYEIDIGTFAAARSPNTENFREFPGWVEEHLDATKDKKVAMFCTGGIRCEKASAYLLAEGFEEVYQLDGGILRYLENVDAQESRWSGECFVFDQRISVTPDLAQGHYKQCFACRHPLDTEALSSEAYEAGVSCPYCIDDLQASRVKALRDRQMQVELAEQRGDQHIGKPQTSKRNRG